MVATGSGLTPQAEAVAAAIAHHRMLSPSEPVLVGFSGGADSTALALVLLELGHNVILGHVDHAMRPESGAEAASCAATAERLGAPFLMEKVKVSPPSQAEARRMRYLALQRMAARCGATRIATGHTLDDQAETVRMRLDRGGFGMGIPPVRENIVRPALSLRRSDTESMCRSAGVPFLNDPSNFNPKYTRVRVRSELAGGSDDEMLRLASTAQQTFNAAQDSDRETVAHVERWVRFERSDALIDRQALRSLEPQQSRNLVRAVAQHLGLEPNPRLLCDIVNKVVPVTGARLAVGMALSVWSEKDVVVMGRWATAAVLPQVKVNVPGVTALTGWGLQLSTEWVDRTDNFTPSNSEELVDGDQLGAFPRIRQWRAGDRFHPLGGPGSRKLQDFFVDAGVPRRIRLTVPILESAGRIAWVAGHRLDERFKVTPQTVRTLKIRIEDMPGTTFPEDP